MFSGIVEALGTVTALRRERGNLHITVRSPFTNELKIDQSIAHNGACLTVIDIKGDTYTVTAVYETLAKTNLGSLQEGDKINLERCVRAGDRLDGHIVQGHVDQVGVCIGVKEESGSWLFSFEYDPSSGNVTVEKGSVCVNGVSLTVVNSKDEGFSVAIIPYTYEHTNLHAVRKGDSVNLEFDILGKYIAKLIQRQK
jgi:riboflavin synthase